MATTRSNQQQGHPTSPYTSRSTTQQNTQASQASASQNASQKTHGKVTPSEIHRRANAAIFDDNARTQPPDQTAQVAADGSMPNFIDPSEVFNPYHYELEKRRREDAEAAQVQSQVQHDLSASVPEENAATVVEEDDNDPKVNKAKKPRKPREKKPRKSEPAIGSGAGQTIAQESLTPQAPKPPSDHMAGEMKAMIEKMREWKSKDPRTFQALWDDMKKGSGAPPAPAQALEPPQQTSLPTRKSKSAKQSNMTSLAAPATTESARPALPGHPTPAQVPIPIKFDTPARGIKQAKSGAIAGLPAAPSNLEGPTSPSSMSIQAASTTQAAANTSAKITWKDVTPTAQPVQPPFVGQSPDGTPASVPGQPLPPVQKGGGTIWPEAKRKALAEAAVKTLNSDPANAGNEIQPETIQQLLAENPSYLDLCVRLEQKNLKFNRGQFARQLLHSVPDLASAQSPQPNQVTPIQDPPPPLPRQSSVLSPTSPGVQNQIPKQKAPTQSAKSALPARTVIKSANPEPPPGSKAAMARKRDFSEIVDLSQLSDYDDDEEPIPKQPRIASPTPEEAPRVVGMSQNMPHLVSTMPTQFSAFNRPQAQQPAYPQMYSNQNAIGNYPGAAPFIAPQVQQQPDFTRPQVKKPQTMVPVVKSLDKKEALRKSYYNPKTVARDVLIAAGRHPTERPLNYHLATIMGRVPSLSQATQADLSTFDWDAIDPGGPPMPRVEEIEIDNAPPKFPVGSKIGRPSLNDSVKVPQFERRGAVATSSNTNPNSLLAKQLSISSGSSQTKQLLQHSLQSKKQALPSSLKDVINAREVRSEPHRHVTPQQSRPETASSPPASMTSTASGSGKRRGRPPGSKNIKSAAAATSNLGQRISVVVDDPLPSYTPYRCKWRGCKAELHNLSTLRRHVTNIHAQIQENEKFECWWKECKLLSKVANEWTASKTFDTQDELLKHVYTDHLSPLSWELGDGPSDVHVGKTKLPSPGLARFAYNPNVSSVKPAPYPTLPNAKTQPSKSIDPEILETQRKAYTSDAVGRQITPRAPLRATQDTPLDPMQLPIEDTKVQNWYLKTHARDKSKGKHSAAEELLRAIIWKKERVGPGIDKGGATLITPALRATLMENEGIARVVDNDEDSDDGAI